MLRHVWQAATSSTAALLCLQVLAQLGFVLQLLPVSAAAQDTALLPVPGWLLDGLGLHRIEGDMVWLQLLQVRLTHPDFHVSTLVSSGCKRSRDCVIC